MQKLPVTTWQSLVPFFHHTFPLAISNRSSAFSIPLASSLPHLPPSLPTHNTSCHVPAASSLTSQLCSLTGAVLVRGAHVDHAS